MSVRKDTHVAGTQRKRLFIAEEKLCKPKKSSLFSRDFKASEASSSSNVGLVILKTDRMLIGQ